MTSPSRSIAALVAGAAPIASVAGQSLKQCDGLTGLRGIAAIAVVIQHALQVLKVNGADDPVFLPLDLGEPWLLLQHVLLMVFNGSAAVVLFFVLSGLVLSISIERDGPQTPWTVAGYWVRRLFRLYPLLVFSTLFSAVLLALVPIPSPHAATTRVAAGWVAVVPDAQSVLWNAIGRKNDLNIPSWSITIELVVSVLFPVFFLVVRRSSRLVGLAFVAALVLIALTAPVRLRYIEVFLPAFALGALVLVHGADVARRVLSWSRPWRWLVIGAVAVAGLSFERLWSPMIWNGTVSMLIIAVASAFIIGLIYFGPWQGFLFRPLVVWLGDISYGIYLLHFTVLMGLVRLVLPQLPASLPPLAALAINFALAAATLALTIPLAWISLWLIEAPLQSIGRRLSRRLKAIRPRPALG